MCTPQGAGALESLARNALVLVRGASCATAAQALLFAPAVGALAAAAPSYLGDRALFVLGTLLVHELLYFGGHAAAQRLERAAAAAEGQGPKGKGGWAARCKLPRRPAQRPSSALVAGAMRRAALSHLALQPLALWLCFGVFGVRNDRADPLPTVLLHLAACQLAECTLFFLSHRLLHTSFLYTRLHKVHHEFKGTVSVAAEHAHPVEQLLGNYLPVLLAPALLQVSLPTWLTWLAWRLLATYERHSGFDFSATALGRLGLLHGDGARYHDHHHMVNKGNYGSGLDFFDVLCGTRVY